jgi:hypothetical protein
MGDADFENKSEAQLEAIVAGAHGFAITLVDVGRAKAELTRRRLECERDRDNTRWTRDIQLADLQGRHLANQQDHETRLAREQMAHAEKLAAQQISAATSSAKATMWAAIAAGLSALGAIVAATVAVAQFLSLR